ncbi:MAG TPA: ATP-binding cassette domain-containing protein, partial [Actinomycetota bacterium]|nr:ATP-binding cassette domain-containing protein [Actinomycetota bacterium]
MLSLEGVSKTYRVGTFGGRELAAVRDVSLQVAPGEVIALIGESGSGKSTIGRMILRLPGVTAGRITFDGVDIAGFKGKGLRSYYAQVQGVFQDPFSSYNPVFRVDRTLELLRQTYFSGLDGRRWRDKV